MTELIQEGRLYTSVGKGTFVAEPKISQSLQALTGFTEDMQLRGLLPSSKVLERSIGLVDADSAFRTGLPLGTVGGMAVQHDFPLDAEYEFQVALVRNNLVVFNGLGTSNPLVPSADLFWDANPTHSKAKIPAGPNNPVGTAWIGLSRPGYGIHGTPDPASIGYSASHGCIRMRIPDAEWLFQRVRIGTPVVIVSA